MKKHSVSIAYMMFLIISALLTVKAFADVENREGIYTLGEIVISGGAESVSTIRKVTARDIRNNGAQNLTDVLKMIPRTKF